MPSTNFYEIAGKADTDPLFPDDPFMAANRRVTITMMREAPPVPPDCSLRRNFPPGLRQRLVVLRPGRRCYKGAPPLAAWRPIKAHE